MGMETINELGAVQLLGIPSLSAGILETWQTEGNPTGAIGLALITLVIVLALVMTERILRRRSRRWSDGVAGVEATTWRFIPVELSTNHLKEFFSVFFSVSFHETPEGILFIFCYFIELIM